MPVRQINIRLLPKLKEQFEEYAARVGISSSELVKLLILREGNLRRLLKLRNQKNVPKHERQQRGFAQELEKITAHLPSLAAVRKFDAYAKRCNLSRNQAGVWLLQTELHEKWLDAALKGV